MRALFIIDSKEASMAFKLAFEIAFKGDKVNIIFTGEGCHHISNNSLIKSLKLEAEIHCLKSDFSQFSNTDWNQFVDWIDYLGWVRLIEKCDTIIMWN